MEKKRALKFENLEVWKLAQDLTVDLAGVFYAKEFRNFSFSDQIMRASISISNNIAEGFGRGGNKELIRYLYISKGSCEEVKNMIYLAGSLNYIEKKQEEDYLQRCITLSVKLNNLINYLKKQ